jgi:hypothetical protein
LQEFHTCLQCAFNKFMPSILFPLLPSAPPFQTMFGEFHYAVFICVNVVYFSLLQPLVSRCEGLARKECEIFPFIRAFYGAESLASSLPRPNLPWGAQSCRACLAAAIYLCSPRLISQLLMYQNSC